MQAGINTANAVKPMTEVMNQAQALSGSRIRDMPLQRMSRVVVMKFNAPSNWPMQKRPIEVAQSTTPRPSPGPPASPIALSGAYCVQPPRVGPEPTKKEIAECGERGGSEHKEDHDSPVHGHQLQVVLRRHHVARRAVLGKQVQAGNRETAESKMEAHEPGKEHSDQGGEQCQRVILLADDFMIKTEDMLPNEACRGYMMHRMCGHIVHCSHLKRDVLV